LKKENADKMEKMAKGPFAKVYPVEAKRIIDKTEIKSGVCIDIGSGGGQLGLSIGEISDFNIVAVDNNEYSLEYAIENAKAMSLNDKFSVVYCDVQELQIESNSVDLCVSRGSFWFWEDGVKAFSEIYRILKPKAKAFIGCGFGTKEMLDEIIEKMESVNPEWYSMRKKLSEDNPVEKYVAFLNQANIKNYTVEVNDTEKWFVFQK